MRRLLIPACLSLVAIGPSTTVGPVTPAPVEPIATSTHAKNKSKPRRRSPPPPASFAERLAPFAAALKAPPASFAERLAPFAAALAAPPADSLERAQRVAAAAADAPRINAYAAVAPANPLAGPSTSSAIVVRATAVAIPMSPPPGTPSSVRKRVVYRSKGEICDTIAKAAHANNVPLPFFIRLLFQESRFDAASLSHAGAQGIAQFMPETAHDVGLANPFDPLQAIPAAAQLLRGFIDRFGNLGLAAAAYNAGPARIDRWLKQRTRLTAETRGYVKTVTGKPANVWKSGKAMHSDTELPEKVPCKPVAAPTAVAMAASVPLPPEPALRLRTAKATLQLAARRQRPKDARD
jgi:soluble lytic murein transglycosylase-like protein